VKAPATAATTAAPPNSRMMAFVDSTQAQGRVIHRVQV